MLLDENADVVERFSKRIILQVSGQANQVDTGPLWPSTADLGVSWTAEGPSGDSFEDQVLAIFGGGTEPLAYIYTCSGTLGTDTATYKYTTPDGKARLVDVSIEKYPGNAILMLDGEPLIEADVAGEGPYDFIGTI